MSERKSTVHLVVTAALIASAGRLFVAQRPPWKRFGLLWEFPGGKVEPGENLEASLVREIREELCLDVKVHELFRTISHVENDFAIHLHAYWCSIFGGNFCLREHVAFKWTEVSDLKVMELTTADRLLVPFLESLPQLPVYPGNVIPEIPD
jgi:8-oxo-dGTP diphosphatase